MLLILTGPKSPLYVLFGPIGTTVPQPHVFRMCVHVPLSFHWVRLGCLGLTGPWVVMQFRKCVSGNKRYS